jgi:hypothetical protein
MNVLKTVVVALLLVFGSASASDSPYFSLKQSTDKGKLQVIGTNVSRASIVAYVVLVERADQRIVWQGVYTGGDTLAPGKTIEVGEAPVISTEQANLTVDDVRLADGTTWGKAITEQAKEVAARFQ